MALNPDLETIAGYRPMTLDDVPGIMNVELQCYPHPWTEGIFRDCIRVGYTGYVYVEDNTILAYGLISIAANEAHVLNVCVVPHKQGQGLGRGMLRKLIESAGEKGADTVFLEVRKSNQTAVKLYESERFKRIGVRKNYYPDDEGREDALVFTRAVKIDNAP